MVILLAVAAAVGWLVALWAIHHANRWHDTCLREREQRRFDEWDGCTSVEVIDSVIGGPGWKPSWEYVTVWPKGQRWPWSPWIIGRRDKGTTEMEQEFGRGRLGWSAWLRRFFE